MEKTQIGIEGLDKALNGGIPQKNLVLVSGGAGTGKSTLCMQFIVNGAMKFNEKGIYISTEQNVDELKKQASIFGWDLDALESQGRVKIMYFDVTGGDDFLKQIGNAFEEFQPQRIAIDSMTTLTDALMISDLTDDTSFSLVQIAESVSPIPRTEQVIAKTILYRLIQEIKKYGVTTLLTSELFEGTDRLSADGISEFITDGVLVMHYLGVGAVDFRSMQIRKMRYTDHKKEVILHEITKEGIKIREEENF